MGPNKNKQNVQLSVFDRLHDEVGFEILGGAADDIHVVRNSVLRDVENLLNTRRNIFDAPESLGYVRQSVYAYGVEDFVSKNPKSPHVRQALKQTIRETIARYEPRLKNIAVDFKPDDGNSQNLCFLVQATLHADPVREPICFDTWFSASRGEYGIKSIK